VRVLKFYSEAEEKFILVAEHFDVAHEAKNLRYFVRDTRVIKKIMLI